MIKYFEARLHHLGVDDETMNLLILRGNSAKHGDVAAIIENSNLLLFIAAFENAIHYINGQSRINDASQRWGIPIDDLQLLVDTYNKL